MSFCNKSGVPRLFQRKAIVQLSELQAKLATFFLHKVPFLLETKNNSQINYDYLDWVFNKIFLENEVSCHFKKGNWQYVTNNKKSTFQEKIQIIENLYPPRWASQLSNTWRIKSVVWIWFTDVVQWNVFHMYIFLNIYRKYFFLYIYIENIYNS